MFGEVKGQFKRYTKKRVTMYFTMFREIKILNKLINFISNYNPKKLIQDISQKYSDSSSRKARLTLSPVSCLFYCQDPATFLNICSVYNSGFFFKRQEKDRQSLLILSVPLRLLSLSKSCVGFWYNFVLKQPVIQFSVE